MPVISDAELRSRLRALIDERWVEMPDIKRYGGTGGPGKFLEHKLGVDGGNDDLPDAGRWELKYHSGKSLLTMFHKEGLPSDHLESLVQNHGWLDQQGRTSFRHTIAGTTGRGFSIESDGKRIIVVNKDTGDQPLAHWAHDTIMNAFVSKLRRVVVVKGERKKQMVRYRTAHFFWEPQITKLIDAIVQGIIYIDFDARTKTPDTIKLRNHGTKFRIKYDDLQMLYHQRDILG